MGNTCIDTDSEVSEATSPLFPPIITPPMFDMEIRRDSIYSDMRFHQSGSPKKLLSMMKAPLAPLYWDHEVANSRSGSSSSIKHHQDSNPIELEMSSEVSIASPATKLSIPERSVMSHVVFLGLRICDIPHGMSVEEIIICASTYLKCMSEYIASLPAEVVGRYFNTVSPFVTIAKSSKYWDCQNFFSEWVKTSVTGEPTYTLLFSAVDEEVKEAFFLLGFIPIMNWRRSWRDGMCIFHIRPSWPSRDFNSLCYSVPPPTLDYFLTLSGGLKFLSLTHDNDYPVPFKIAVTLSNLISEKRAEWPQNLNQIDISFTNAINQSPYLASDSIEDYNNKIMKAQTTRLHFSSRVEGALPSTFERNIANFFIFGDSTVMKGNQIYLGAGTEPSSKNSPTLPWVQWRFRAGKSISQFPGHSPPPSLSQGNFSRPSHHPSLPKYLQQADSKVWESLDDLMEFCWAHSTRAEKYTFGVEVVGVPPCWSIARVALYLTSVCLFLFGIPVFFRGGTSKPYSFSTSSSRVTNSNSTNPPSVYLMVETGTAKECLLIIACVVPIFFCGGMKSASSDIEVVEEGKIPNLSDLLQCVVDKVHFITLQDDRQLGQPFFVIRPIEDRAYYSLPIYTPFDVDRENQLLSLYRPSGVAGSPSNPANSNNPGSSSDGSVTPNSTGGSSTGAMSPTVVMPSFANGSGNGGGLNTGSTSDLFVFDVSILCLLENSSANRATMKILEMLCCLIHPSKLVFLFDCLAALGIQRSAELKGLILPRKPSRFGPYPDLGPGAADCGQQESCGKNGSLSIGSFKASVSSVLQAQLQEMRDKFERCFRGAPDNIQSMKTDLEFNWRKKARLFSLPHVERIHYFVDSSTRLPLSYFLRKQRCIPSRTMANLDPVKSVKIYNDALLDEYIVCPKQSKCLDWKLWQICEASYFVFSSHPALLKSFSELYTHDLLLQYPNGGGAAAAGGAADAAGVPVSSVSNTTAANSRARSRSAMESDEDEDNQIVGSSTTVHPITPSSGENNKITFVNNSFQQVPTTVVQPSTAPDSWSNWESFSVNSNSKTLVSYRRTGTVVVSKVVTAASTDTTASGSPPLPPQVVESQAVVEKTVSSSTAVSSSSSPVVVVPPPTDTDNPYLCPWNASNNTDSSSRPSARFPPMPRCPLCKKCKSYIRYGELGCLIVPCACILCLSCEKLLGGKCSVCGSFITSRVQISIDKADNPAPISRPEYVNNGASYSQSSTPSPTTQLVFTGGNANKHPSSAALNSIDSIPVGDEATSSPAPNGGGGGPKSTSTLFSSTINISSVDNCAARAVVVAESTPCECVESPIRQVSVDTEGPPLEPKLEIPPNDSSHPLISIGEPIQMGTDPHAVSDESAMPIDSEQGPRLGKTNDSHKNRNLNPPQSLDPINSLLLPASPSLIRDTSLSGQRSLYSFRSVQLDPYASEGVADNSHTTSKIPRRTMLLDGFKQSAVASADPGPFNPACNESSLVHEEEMKPRPVVSSNPVLEDPQVQRNPAMPAPLFESSSPVLKVECTPPSGPVDVSVDLGPPAKRKTPQRRGKSIRFLRSSSSEPSPDSAEPNETASTKHAGRHESSTSSKVETYKPVPPPPVPSPSTKEVTSRDSGTAAAALDDKKIVKKKTPSLSDRLAMAREAKKRKLEAKRREETMKKAAEGIFSDSSGEPAANRSRKRSSKGRNEERGRRSSSSSEEEIPRSSTGKKRKSPSVRLSEEASTTGSEKVNTSNSVSSSRKDETPSSSSYRHHEAASNVVDTSSLPTEGSNSPRSSSSRKTQRKSRSRSSVGEDQQSVVSSALFELQTESVAPPAKIHKSRNDDGGVPTDSGRVRRNVVPDFEDSEEEDSNSVPAAPEIPSKERESGSRSSQARSSKSNSELANSKGGKLASPESSSSRSQRKQQSSSTSSSGGKKDNSKSSVSVSKSGKGNASASPSSSSSDENESREGESSLSGTSDAELSNSSDKSSEAGDDSNDTLLHQLTKSPKVTEILLNRLISELANQVKKDNKSKTSSKRKTRR